MSVDDPNIPRAFDSHTENHDRTLAIPKNKTSETSVQIYLREFVIQREDNRTTSKDYLPFNAKPRFPNRAEQATILFSNFA